MEENICYLHEVYTFSVVLKWPCRVVSRTGEKGKRQTMEDLVRPTKDFALNDMSVFHNLPVQRNPMKCLLQYWFLGPCPPDPLNQNLQRSGMVSFMLICQDVHCCSTCLQKSSAGTYCFPPEGFLTPTWDSLVGRWRKLPQKWTSDSDKRELGGNARASWMQWLTHILHCVPEFPSETEPQLSVMAVC